MEVKKTCYLHVEAINFAATLFDTQDLSTVRGSSLAALNAIKEVDGIKTLTHISLGASIGLWSFVGNEKAIKDEVKIVLGKCPYKYLSFAVETCEASDFLAAKETLITQVRKFQLQTRIKPLDFTPPHEKLRQVCQLDYFSPANKIASIKGEKNTYVSRSVYDRRNYGRDKKQTFYNEFYDIPNQDKYPFALHFSSICEQDNVREQLKGKMAVFYADGNSFSKKISQAVKNGAKLDKIDSNLRKNRKEFLSKALEVLIKKATGMADAKEIEERRALSKRLEKEGKPSEVTENIIRFETLLWGGDEFMFVMPARLGFEIAKIFYDESSKWKINSEPLTFASGLVFCHHNSPISRIATLAKNLAEKAKDQSRDENLINALVLESFDHVGSEFDNFWQKRHPLQKILTKADMDTLICNAKKLDSDGEEWFSRRQLKSGAFALHRGEHNKRDFATILAHMHKNSSDKSKEYFGESDEKKAYWLQLDEFWDYLNGEMENAQAI